MDHPVVALFRSVFDGGCLLAQELIKQLLQLVEGLGQTLSADPGRRLDPRFPKRAA